ncbi:MAG: hypothetical protein WA581_01680 [Candidatus Acidiferrales bacterium]
MPKNPSHVLAGLLRNEETLEVDSPVRWIRGILIGLLGARRGAVELHQDIVTNRVNEGAEPLGLANAGLTSDGFEDPCESFLFDILNGRRRDKPRPQLDLQKIAKIGNEVGFRQRIAVPETSEIRRIK